jgi:hypothetical protein
MGSGAVRRGTNPPRGTFLVMVPARAPSSSSSSLFGCQRPPSARAGRTSGRGAIAESAITPLAHSTSELLIQISSRKAGLWSHPAGGPTGRRLAPGRNEEGPPGFPGGPSWRGSDGRHFIRLRVLQGGSCCRRRDNYRAETAELSPL